MTSSLLLLLLLHFCPHQLLHSYSIHSQKADSLPHVWLPSPLLINKHSCLTIPFFSSYCFAPKLKWLPHWLTKLQPHWYEWHKPPFSHRLADNLCFEIRDLSSDLGIPSAQWWRTHRRHSEQPQTLGGPLQNSQKKCSFQHGQNGTPARAARWLGQKCISCLSNNSGSSMSIKSNVNAILIKSWVFCICFMIRKRTAPSSYSNTLGVSALCKRWLTLSFQISHFNISRFL